MRVVALGVLVVGLLAGCSQREEPAPSYTPVPDERLFAQVAELPGVLGEDLRWTDEFGYPNRYEGPVFVERGRDECRVLDRSFAILRQGRPDASIVIEVVQGPPVERPDPGFHIGQVDSRLSSRPERRYGPQPGDGKPPDDELCRGR